MKRTTIIIIVMLVAGLFIVPFGWLDMKENNKEKEKPKFGVGEYQQRVVTFPDVNGLSIVWEHKGVTDTVGIESGFVYQSVHNNPLVCVKCIPSDSEVAEFSYSSKWDDYMTVIAPKDGKGMIVKIMRDSLLEQFDVDEVDTFELKLPVNAKQRMSFMLSDCSVDLNGLELDSLNLSQTSNAQLTKCKIRSVRSSALDLHMSDVAIKELYRIANYGKIEVMGKYHIGKEYILPNSRSTSSYVRLGNECDEVILLAEYGNEIEVTVNRPAKIVFDK